MKFFPITSQKIFNKKLEIEYFFTAPPTHNFEKFHQFGFSNCVYLCSARIGPFKDAYGFQVTQF